MIRRPFYIVAFCSVAFTWSLAIAAPTPTLGHQSGKNQIVFSPGPIEKNLPKVKELPKVKISLRPESPGQSDRARIASPKELRFDNDVPSLRVSTVGPDTLVVGKPATYIITLANLSRFPARGVVVGISLPKWVQLRNHRPTTVSADRLNRPATGEYLVWNVEKVGALEKQDLSLTVVPKAGRPFELNIDLSVRPRTSTTRIAVTEPKLSLKLVGPEDFVLGDSATWKIVVRNPGTGDAHKVNVDVYSDGNKLASQRIGTIEAGVERTVELSVRPDLAGPGKLRTVAAGELGLEAQAFKPYLVRRSNLRVELLGPSFEYAGIEATYDVRVYNTGNAAAKNVQVMLSMPPHVQYASGLQDADVLSSGVSWKVPNIDAGAENVFKITCQLLQGGDHEFAVKATTKDGQEAAQSVVTQVESVADLKLDVIDPKGPRAVGSEMEYEIHVTNRGTDVARQITVIAVCSPEIETVDVTGNAAIKSGQIFFRPIGQLQSGRKIVHKITVRALKEGSHRFRVVVQCLDPDTRLASEETTRFFIRPPSRIAVKPAPKPTSR